MNQGFNNNGFNNIINNSQELNTNNLNNAININQSNNQPINETLSANNNLENSTNNINGISKKGKVMMFIVLICAFIIFFDNFIKSMDWFTNLQVQYLFNHDEQLKLALETFVMLIEVGNWVIVAIITILSIIFRIIDKKKNCNVRVYEWYIVAGILHILIGTIGITSIIYSISTLVFATKNKKNNKINNLSVKSDNALIVLSLILIVAIIFMFVINN